VNGILGQARACVLTTGMVIPMGLVLLLGGGVVVGMRARGKPARG